MVDEHPHRIGYVDTLNHLGQCGAVLVLGSTERHYTPSKVFQAILSKRPVFALLHAESTAVGMIEQAGAGKVLPLTEFAERHASRTLPGDAAAITFDDYVAHGLLAGLASHNIVVPRDFSVIGCDDVLGASTYPALTSVSARCDEAGRMAADLLISAFQSGKRADVRCLLDTCLVIRDTTAPAPKLAQRKLLVQRKQTKG